MHHTALLGDSYDAMGEIEVSMGDHGAARRWHEKSLDIRLTLASADPENLDMSQSVAKTYNLLGDVLMGAGDSSTALELYEKSLEITSALSIADPENATCSMQ